MADTVELSGREHKRTARALLFSLSGNEREAEWLPLSQISREQTSNDVITLEIPEWLAIEKGLV